MSASGAPANSNILDAVLVVPCFNERSRLPLAHFSAFLQEHLAFRLVFVDDGSTDGTADLIEEYFSNDHRHRVEVLRLPQNQGKAEAVRRGFLHAYSDAGFPPKFVGFVDADLATPLDDIARAMQVARRRNDIFLVMGVRLGLSGRRIERTLRRKLAGAAFSLAISVGLGITLRDTQCGAKIFRSDHRFYGIFDQPFSDRWLFDVELLARIQGTFGKHALERVFEQPLENWREVDGSKLKLIDFIKAPISLAKIFLRYRVSERWVNRRLSSTLSPETQIRAFTQEEPTQGQSPAMPFAQQLSNRKAA